MRAYGGGTVDEGGFAGVVLSAGVFVADMEFVALEGIVFVAGSP